MCGLDMLNLNCQDQQRTRVTPFALLHQRGCEPCEITAANRETTLASTVYT